MHNTRFFGQGGMIHIGTCGFSYDDWKGVFYPEGLGKRDFLCFYADNFPALELNSSFYAIPSPSLVANLIHRTPSGFRVVVKAYKEITHGRDQGAAENLKAFLKALGPLAESGKLGAVLFQFPFSFHYGDEGLDYLDSLLGLTGGFPTVVEFRSAGWMKKRVWELLRSHGAALCCVDEPPLPGLVPPKVVCTSPLAGYVRFHGRNSSKWWNYEESWERYDYLYQESELKGWVKGIRWLESRTDETYVFFNNHRAGQAVTNARQMALLLGLPGMGGGGERADSN